ILPATILGGLFLLAVSDHALNLMVVRQATRECYAAIDRVAHVCAREMPPGSCLLSNAHQGLDVQLRGNHQFTSYFSTMTGGWRQRLVATPQALDALMNEAGDQRVFCLDV